MMLLDSLLAFALTLAALATVVTILLEIFIRFFGAKRRGQVKMIGQLLDENMGDYLPDGEARWQAIKDILQNPLAERKMAASEDEQDYKGRAAGGIYIDVSLEHVLRRLLESRPTGALLLKTRDDLEKELTALANRYDEFSAALVADFKRRAQMWSILAGIVLALAMNIDGLRLLQGYLQDPDLRRSVIEQLPTQPPEGPSEGAAESDVDAYVAELKKSLADISGQALPMGGGYFPHCYLAAALSDDGAETKRVPAVDPLCRAGTPESLLLASLAWILKVLVTGMLIGLGAPFWYDVARRLTAVRTVFNGKPAGEERFRGADARKPGDREDLIDRVIKDAGITA